jgi:hypothetical protein
VPENAQQTPVVLSQPDVLLPRLPHDVWGAIRDGGVAAAREAAAKPNATVNTIVAAAVGACTKSATGSFSGFACCFCSRKCKSAASLKAHMKLKPDCKHILCKFLEDARPSSPPAPTAAAPVAPPVTRAATKPAAALHRADDSSLTAAWEWAATLNTDSLPALDLVPCARRIPRSLQLDFDLIMSMVLSRLRGDPCDLAANHMLFLIPRIILRRDPSKGDTSNNNGRAARDALLRNHALAMPAGDCLKIRIERFKNGDWKCLFEDYLRAAAVQREHRSSKPSNNRSEAALRQSAYQKADRLVGCNELSRAANAVISTCRAENDAALAACRLAAKHPTTGGLSEDVAAAIDVALSESSDVLQIVMSRGCGHSLTTRAARRRVLPAGRWNAGRTCAPTIAVVGVAQPRHRVRRPRVGARQAGKADAQQLALLPREPRVNRDQRARRAALEEVKPGDRGAAHIPACGKSAGSSCTCTPAHAMRRPPLAQIAGAPLSPLSTQQTS